MENQNTPRTGSPITPPSQPIIPNPLDILQKPPPSSKRLITIIVVVSAAFLGFLVAGYLIIMKDAPKKATYVSAPTPTKVPDTSGWTSYTYKHIMLKHPEDWAVVFTSDVDGKPDDFSLHFQHKDATGIQPDEIRISTFNDRSRLPNEVQYELMPTKKFGKKGDQGDDYIQFKVGGTTIYAGCAFYNEGYKTISICNQILLTIRSTK